MRKEMEKDDEKNGYRPKPINLWTISEMKMRLLGAIH